MRKDAAFNFKPDNAHARRGRIKNSVARGSRNTERATLEEYARAAVVDRERDGARNERAGLKGEVRYRIGGEREVAAAASRERTLGESDVERDVRTRRAIGRIERWPHVVEVAADERRRGNAAQLYAGRPAAGNRAAAEVAVEKDGV